MTLLLVALGAFFLTETVKVAVPATLHPWVKLVLAGAIAAFPAAVLVDDYWETVVVAIAGAGLAALIHKGHRLLSALGDSQQVAVMMKASGQGRRLG